MRSSSSYRRDSGKKPKRKSKRKLSKAQFFMLTGFVIIAIFYAVSKWIEPYTILDTSQAARAEELFVFSNIKQEALDIVAEAKSCEDMVNNIEEFKYYIEGYAFKKLIIYFDYSLETPCFEGDPMFPTLVLFDIELSSPRINVNDQFYGFWPPGSEPL